MKFECEECENVRMGYYIGWSLKMKCEDVMSGRSVKMEI